MPAILHEQRDQVSIIRLSTPESLNALSVEMVGDLSHLFTTLNSDSDTRAIILTGACDKAFCAGDEMGGVADEQAHEISKRFHALCDQIENCGVPVIGTVNGLVAGNGWELALACHLRIAADNAQFSLADSRRGVFPGDGGTQRLEREIGAARAREMMLAGGPILAEDALRFGLVNRVVPAAELLAEAEGLAGEIARLAPLAIRACLQAVTQGTQLALAEGLALESKLFASLFSTEDMREGTSAFLEKRAPVFKGK